MSVFSQNDASDVYWQASPEIRQVILNEARTNIAARQAAMIALEQRVSQAGAALFAAAAFSATFAVTFRDTGFAFSALGGLATIAFVVGAAVSLEGMRAGDIIFVGMSPSWWKPCTFLDDDNPEKAECWVTGQLELVIQSYDEISKRRARHLNIGLNYALAGGFLVGVAGYLAIFL